MRAVISLSLLGLNISSVSLPPLSLGCVLGDASQMAALASHAVYVHAARAGGFWQSTLTALLTWARQGPL